MEKEKQPVVLIVDKVYSKCKEVFDKAEGLTWIVAPADEEKIAKLIIEKKVFAVVLDTQRYKGPLYQAMPERGLLARFGVGYDGIDFEKAKQNSLFVTNTPGVLETTVAELTVFLAGDVLRKISYSNREMAQNRWNPAIGNDLRGKVWGIIGFGNIGKEISRILSFGFGVKVLAFKREAVNLQSLNKECGIEALYSDFSEIVSKADIVSLHLPVNKDTYHYMNKDRLNQLKPGTILINTGRGALIDENALYDLLESGHIAGAGLDVFENEPYKPLDPEKDFRKLKNVVLVPHIGSFTEECSKRMAEKVIQNIRYAAEGEFGKMDIIAH